MISSGPHGAAGFVAGSHLGASAVRRGELSCAAAGAPRLAATRGPSPMRVDAVHGTGKRKLIKINKKGRKGLTGASLFHSVCAAFFPVPSTVLLDGEPVEHDPGTSWTEGIRCHAQPMPRLHPALQTAHQAVHVQRSVQGLTCLCPEPAVHVQAENHRALQRPAPTGARPRPPAWPAPHVTAAGTARAKTAVPFSWGRIEQISSPVRVEACCHQRLALLEQARVASPLPGLPVLFFSPPNSSSLPASRPRYLYNSHPSLLVRPPSFVFFLIRSLFLRSPPLRSLRVSCTHLCLAHV